MTDERRKELLKGTPFELADLATDYVFGKVGEEWEAEEELRHCAEVRQPETKWPVVSDLTDEELARVSR